MKIVKPTTMLTVPMIIEKVYKGSVLPTIEKSRTLRWMNEHMNGLMCRIIGMKLKKTFGGRISFYGIGGAKLDPEVEKFLLKARFPYAIGYGLTETAPMAAGQIPGTCRIGATGPAMCGVDIRLDNINPETGLGEVVIKSPSVMQGYYKNPEATAEVFTEDGWFRSGDLGEFDKDGYLYIKGRLKNMILGPSGENIYPEDIESVLNSHAFVSESVVTEQDGRLIALVHFDSEAIEKLKDEFMTKLEITRDEWNQKKDEWNKRMEEIKQEVMKYVNSKVNRFSKITAVIEEEKEFEKTPSKKIRRFLYTNKTTDKK